MPHWQGGHGLPPSVAVHHAPFEGTAGGFTVETPDRRLPDLPARLRGAAGLPSDYYAASQVGTCSCEHFLPLTVFWVIQ